jgi:hypothetical protein
LEVVESASERKLFEQYIERYHYLGYRVPYGAQLRYFVRSQQPPHAQLACLLFTSAAWRMAPRDRYIGWEEQARRRNLARVVNNSRFLILPWVQIANLASHILSAVAARLKSDWRDRYAVEPALLETLVDRSRYLAHLIGRPTGSVLGRRKAVGEWIVAARPKARVRRSFCIPSNETGNSS